MASHSSILSWEILWTEEPDGLQSMGSQRVGQDWATHTHTHTHTHTNIYIYIPLQTVGLFSFPNQMSQFIKESLKKIYSWYQIYHIYIWLFVASQFLSRVWLSVTPWTAAHRLPCPSLFPGVCLNSCPLSWWCYLTISSFAAPSPLALNLSQHQGLFQWFLSSHQVAKVLEHIYLISDISAGWRCTGAGGVVQSKSKDLSSRRTDGSLSEGNRRPLFSSSSQAEKVNSPFFCLLCYSGLQWIGWGRQSALLSPHQGSFTESTDSNANVILKHPHRQTQKKKC